MKKKCTALLLFVILILGTVVPAYAEAVQEYPETESRSITAEQEYPGAESGSIPPEQEENSNQEYAEEDSDLAFTENESDPELTEEGPGPELTEDGSALELTEDGSGLELTEDGSGPELSEEGPGPEYEEFSEPSLSAAADGTYGDDSEIVDDWANCYYRAIVAVDVSDGVITGIDGQGDTDDEWSIDCFQAALNALKNRLIGQPVSAAQSLQTDVDAVSEATYSSNALILEIQKALNSDPKGPYTLEWKNGEQSLQLLDKVKYGTATPDYSGETPVRQADTEGSYVFTGWNPAKEIWVTQDVTYTAEFEKTTSVYSITYDLGGGTLPSGENPQEYTADTETFTLINPVKEGYAFAGWTGTGITGKAMEVTIAAGSTGDRSYTATWKKAAQGPDVQDGVYIDGTGEVAGYYYHPYVRITVEDGRISSVDVTAQDVGSNTSFLNTAAAWLRDGLVGEYASGISVDAIDAVSGATFTKNALRTAAKKALDPEDSWLISWENYDGSLLDRAFVTTGTVPAYEGEKPEKEDHFFIGWVPEITAAAADTTYTADFRSADTVYTVTYDLNGGSVDSPDSFIDQSVHQAGDSVAVLSGPAPFLNGYKFLGWKYGDRILTAGDTFTMPPSPVTLTAVWKEWHGESIYGDDSSVDPLGYLEKIYVSVEVNDNNEILSVTADADASPEDLELLEFDKALEWVNDQLLYFDIVSEGADSLEMYYYMAEGSDFLYAQPIIGGVMAALQQEPKPLITVNVTDEQGTLLSTISGIRYGTRFSDAVPEAPVKPEDASNTYSFTGWDETTVPFILTADAEVCACYKATAKEPKDISAAVISDIAPVSYTGSPITPEFTVTEAGENGRVLTKGKDFTLSYADNTNAGTASVTITGRGDFTGTVRKTFKILPKKIKPQITLSKTSFTYNGKTQKPSVTVKDGKAKLASANYTVTYASGCKNAGTYKVTVRLKGNYSGSNTVSYKISARKITPAVTLARTVYTWNGKAQKPSVTVKDGKTKLASANYTVTYASGCKNVGTYKVTVRLKGNYSGSKAVSFRINPKGTSLTRLTAASRAFTAGWKKQASQTTGYQIQYSTSPSFKSGNKTVTVKGTGSVSKKIAKLGAGKTYYVRIRTYRTVGKKNYYSAWSAKKSVKTKSEK